MSIPDFINGVFETTMGVMAFFNVKALIRDREIKGVHWGVTGVAAAWGYYNLYFYPHLHQWFSFAGGCLIVSVNSLWLVLAAFYATRARKSC